MIQATRVLPNRYEWYYGSPFVFYVSGIGLADGAEILAVLRRVGDPDQQPILTFDASVFSETITLQKDPEDVLFLRKGTYEVSIEYIGAPGTASRVLFQKGFFVVRDEIEVRLLAPGWIYALALSDTEVDVLWSPVVGATSYVLQRSVDAIVWSSVYSGSSTSFSDTGLSTGVTYYYRVRALRSGYPDSGYVQTSVTTLSSGYASVNVVRYTAVADNTVTFTLSVLIGKTVHLAFRSMNEFNVITSGTPVNDELLINSITGAVTLPVANALATGERVTILYS